MHDATTKPELEAALKRADIDLPDTAETDALFQVVIDLNAKVIDRRDTAAYCARIGETPGVIASLNRSVKFLEAQRDDALLTLINHNRAQYENA